MLEIVSDRGPLKITFYGGFILVIFKLKLKEAETKINLCQLYCQSGECVQTNTDIIQHMRSNKIYCK